MKVVHVISSIDVSTGGPAVSVTSAVQGIIDNSIIDIKLYSSYSENPELVALKFPERTVKFFEVNRIGRFKGIGLNKDYGQFSIFHIHGMWQLSLNQFVNRARRLNLPYILSPHGMLEPWALNQARWKKKIALILYQMRGLKNAACLHVTSEMEARSIRELGLNNPIALIPNPINILPFDLSSFDRVSSNKILFLSRIHPKKGIENLINAWQQIPFSIKNGWKLEIVGNGEAKYVGSLKLLINEKKLCGSVSILDPVFGVAKNDVYLSADVFVLPTFSENFGMVIAEAMALGLPVITTKGAPWAELETHNAGWWIDIGVEPLALTLSEAMITPKEKLVEMGNNGRELIKEKYSVEKVSNQMVDLYKWVLKKGDKPDFVY
jgi:glycosyltransferase involved in cell wall biosynthesis